MGISRRTGDDPTLKRPLCEYQTEKNFSCKNTDYQFSRKKNNRENRLYWIETHNPLNGDREMRSPHTFKNGTETYNRLSPIPEVVIDLQDGRELRIQEWETRVNEDDMASCFKVDVTLHGYIVMPKPEE